MKTTILKTNKLLIALAMMLTFGSTAFSQIAVPDSNSIPLSCDASFKDMLPLILLPANTDMTNLVALGPVDQNDYNKEYFWDLGDGTLDTGKIVLHNYKKPGKYLVTLHSVQHIIGFVSSFDIKCSHSEWMTAGISEPVKTCDASFHPWILATTDYPSSYSSIVGYEAQKKTYKSYHWDFGDGTKDTGRSVSHHFVNEGKYLVSLTIKDENCEDTKTIWMTKRGYYFPIDSTTRCNARILKTINGNTITFNDPPMETLVALIYDGNYETWTWDFGDGQQANGSYVTHTYAKQGKYLATLTKSSYYDPCFKTPTTCFAQPILRCTNTQQFEVVIGNNSLCQSNISYSINGYSVEVKDNGFDVPSKVNFDTTVSRAWLFSESPNTFGTGRSITRTYSKSGHYRIGLIKQISLYYEQAKPNDSDLIKLVLQSPAICIDTTYIDFEIGVQQPSCKAKMSYKLNNNTIEITDSIAHVSSIPVISDPIKEYRTWDFGDGSISTKILAISNNKTYHTYANPGKYRIRLIKSITNDPCGFTFDSLVRCLAPVTLLCTDTTYLDVEIGDQKPICKAYFETKIDSNKVTIEANSTGKFLKYSRLDFGDGTVAKINDSVFTISHYYSQNGKYDVCLYISTIDSILPYVRYSNMCNDLVCQTITISDSVSDPLVASIYPNPASDYMAISIKNNFNKMDLRMYDQTGKLKKEVFEILSDSKEIDTNGLENGLYFYTLSDGENVVLKGKIAVSK